MERNSNVLEDRKTNRRQLELFCSYAHEDFELMEQLKTHLRILERADVLKVWTDKEISPGDSWRDAIDSALANADIVILLVTPSFLDSDYCFDNEMATSMEMHRQGTIRVIPIIARPCYWQLAEFSALQVAPTFAKPVTTFLDRDAAWTDVAKRIHNMAREIHDDDDDQAFASSGRKPRDPSPVKLNADQELILRFLSEWSRYSFNAPRIQKWGSRRPSFADLGKLSTKEITAELEELEKMDLVVSKESSKPGSSSILYSAK